MKINSKLILSLCITGYVFIAFVSGCGGEKGEATQEQVDSSGIEIDSAAVAVDTVAIEGIEGGDDTDADTLQ